MSVIKQEIKQCMLELNKGTGGKVLSRFSFPSSFVGFKGHFPGRPVLPAICQIQALIVIAEELHKKKMNLKKIILTKFFKPVSQNEELLFDYSESIRQGSGIVLAALVSGISGEKIAKLELEVRI